MRRAHIQGMHRSVLDPLYNEPNFNLWSLATLGVTPFRTFAQAVVGGPNIQFSSGWFPDQWPNPTSMTALGGSGAFIKYVVKGFRRSIVKFTNTASTLNASGTRMVPRAGFVAYRYAYTDVFPLVYSDWKYGVPVQTGDGCTVTTEEVDPDRTTMFWWVMNNPPDAEGLTTEWEMVRNSGNELGNLMTVTHIGGDSASPIWGTAGLGLGIFFVVTNRNYLVIGDSQSSGYVTLAGSDGSVTFRSPVSWFLERHLGAPAPILSRLAWSNKGVVGSWAWKLMETRAALGTGTETHFDIINLSQPGRWIGNMGPNLRAFWEAYFPGLYPDYSTSFEYLLKGSQQYTAGGFWANSLQTWVPSKIILGSAGNDQREAASEIRESAMESYFRGTAIKDAICARNGGTSLIAKLRAKWGSVKIFTLLCAAADSGWGAGVDTKAQLRAGFNGSDASNYYDAIGLGAGTDTWLYAKDMADLGTSINPLDTLGTAIHPTSAQTEEIRAAVQTDFNNL